MKNLPGVVLCSLALGCTVDAAKSSEVAWVAYAADAGYADRAGSAASAADAGHAGTADTATTAGTATSAGHATTADYAADAGYAATAGNAAHATSADYAADAGHADTAGYAADAGYATSAGTASHANSADYSAAAGYAADAGYANTAGSAARADYAPDAGNAAMLGGVPAANYLQQDSLHLSLPSGSRTVVTSPFASATVGGVFCGTTADATTGALSDGNGNTGYKAAKKLCEAASACGPNALAHMCTWHEIAISAQLGLVPLSPATGYWYSAGGGSVYPSPVTYLNDCGGWIHSETTYMGSTLSSDSGSVGFSWANCNGQLKIACCL
jgi:hypothetical protein